MVGHVFAANAGVVFVDPPLVPGLITAATKLGSPEAVILTTRNHTRATAFLHKRLGIKVYLPEQDPNNVDPREAAKVKDIGDFETYKAGKVLGFRAQKFGSEHVLLTEEMELLVGDIATGDSTGRLVLWPDWYSPGPPYDAYSRELKSSERQEIREEVKGLVKRTGATSLLVSHGSDIIGKLQACGREL